ncbi:hypothetical protein ABK040_009114 [Willaertia magna]
MGIIPSRNRIDSSGRSSSIHHLKIKNDNKSPNAINSPQSDSEAMSTGNLTKLTKRSRSATLPIHSLFGSKREEGEGDLIQQMYNRKDRQNGNASSSSNTLKPTKLQISSSHDDRGDHLENHHQNNIYDSDILSPSSSNDGTKITSVVSLGYDEEGNKTINEYTLITTIGKGSYGKVKLCMDSSNRPYAIKMMNKSTLKRIKKAGGGNMLIDVQREIAILKKLDHSNIVKLYEVIDDPKNDMLYLVIEYVENGPILTMSETSTSAVAKPCKYTLNQVRKYMIQIIAGLQYLHRQGICHRDIKPENILIDADDNIKLSDFGVSQIVEGDDDLIKTAAGTPAFMSPESIKGDPYSGFKSDIWALGVTLYVILFNSTPFQGESYIQIYNSIQNEHLVIPHPLDKDYLLKDLFSKLLDKNPETRMDLKQFKHHPWLSATYELDSNGQLPKEAQQSQDNLLGDDILPNNNNYNFEISSETSSEAEAITVTENEVKHAIVQGEIERKSVNLALIVKIKRRMKQAALKAKQHLIEKEDVLSSSSEEVV